MEPVKPIQQPGGREAPLGAGQEHGPAPTGGACGERHVPQGGRPSRSLEEVEVAKLVGALRGPARQGSILAGLSPPEARTAEQQEESEELATLALDRERVLHQYTNPSAPAGAYILIVPDTATSDMPWWTSSCSWPRK